MASSVDIVPSLGQGLSFLHEGPGASPGYGAIDRRRMLVAAGVREGIVHEAAYAVSAAGTGMTVLVGATGGMVNVQGDSVAMQGIYTVAPHASNITLDIAAAHSTLPRNDIVVLEVLDDDHDNGGLNKARVKVVTGTATSGAAPTDAFGVNGTPSVSANQFPLALLNVPAGDTVITSSQIRDRRLRTAGALSIATAESRSSTSYGTLATPDLVRNLVLPTDGLIFLVYRAQWKESVVGAARAAIFLDGNQVKVPFADPDGLHTWEASHESGNVWAPLISTGVGLVGRGAGDSPASPISFPATGLGLGFFGGVSGTAGVPEGIGGVMAIEATAGVYDVSIQPKASSGSVTAQDRKLRVWTQPFPG